MEFRSNFPWSVISASILGDLVYREKRNYLDSIDETDDFFSYRFRSITVHAKSIEELKTKLSDLTGREFFNLKLRNLSFSIRNKEWSMVFNGNEDKKEVIFSDITKGRLARGKNKRFTDFWKDQIDQRYLYIKKTWRILVTTSFVEHIDLAYAFVAIFGELFNIFTWRYLYSSTLVLVPGLLVFIQFAMAFPPALILFVFLIRIDYWEERKGLLRMLFGEKGHVLGMLEEHFSLWIRITLIPLIVLIYTDSSFLSLFPTVPHAFLQQFVDVTPLEIIETFVLLVTISLFSNYWKGKALNPTKPIIRRFQKKL